MSIKNKIFEKIHGGNLVYNTCWEDPRCDRALLQLDGNSRVLMITSAGCNALDYLLDNPMSIDCVDINPRQNALLELKQALFAQGDFETLFDFFGKSSHPQPEVVCRGLANSFLSEYSGKYWKKHGKAFSGKGLKGSFYYFGTSGSIAFALKKFLSADPMTRKNIRKMFEAEDLYRQRLHYYRIEPRLLNRFASFALKSHVVQSMLGVPRSQQELAKETFSDGMIGYIRYCFRRVFAEQSLSDNYFWKLYFNGRYEADCCPNYLKKDNFDILKNRADRIRTHTSTINTFLQSTATQYTHFVLLDHMDWLAANNKPALEEEWRLIFERAVPGAKVLFRSAAFDKSFLPDFVLNTVRFDEEKVRMQHYADRVGTYAGVHLGEIGS